MAKLTTNDLVNLQNETTAVTTINNNFAAVETALENTLSRDGTSPNTMGANLDMNSNRITNLPAPIADTEPLRVKDLADYTTATGTLLTPTVVGDADMIARVTSGLTIDYGPSKQDASGNLTPNTSGSANLGTPTLPWGLAYLRSTGELNFGNGNMRVVHTTNTLTVPSGTVALPAVTTTGITINGASTLNGNLVFGSGGQLTPSSASIQAYINTLSNTTTRASIQLAQTGNSLLTTPSAGAMEYDSNILYFTPTANSRGIVEVLYNTLAQADYPLANVATAQNLFPSNQDAISLVANTTYRVRALLYITRSAGATSHTIAFRNNGGTATSLGGFFLIKAFHGTALGTANEVLMANPVGGTTTITTATTNAAMDLYVVIEGVITTSAAGTYIPAIQYSSAPGGAPTVKRGSYFEFTPLGDQNFIETTNWA